MLQPTLHRDATARTLAAARIFILVCWVLKLLAMDLAALGYLPKELFHPFGLMQLFPPSTIAWLTEPGVLAFLRWTLLAMLLLGITGAGGKRTLAGTAILLTLCFGITKGFGGHVNHRELVLLYATWLLILTPCFDALSLRRSIPFKRDSRTYASSMQMVAILIMLSYFFVAMARLCVGMPNVFDPQVMYEWVLSRNVRPNPAGGNVRITNVVD